MLKGQMEDDNSELCRVILYQGRARQKALGQDKSESFVVSKLQFLELLNCQPDGVELLWPATPTGKEEVSPIQLLKESIVIGDRLRERRKERRRFIDDWRLRFEVRVLDEEKLKFSLFIRVVPRGSWSVEVGERAKNGTMRLNMLLGDVRNHVSVGGFKVSELLGKS